MSEVPGDKPTFLRSFRANKMAKVQKGAILLKASNWFNGLEFLIFVPISIFF